MKESEKWKKVIGFRYSVSDHGRVRNDITKKILHPNRIAKYLGVTLCRPGLQKIFLVHRLVGKAFIKNPQNKPCINHKDGIKYNNYAINLEWVTHSENMKHSFSTGLQKPKKTNLGNFGGESFNARAVKCLSVQGKYLSTFDTIRNAAKSVGVVETAIHAALSGRSQTSAGYKWKYA